MKNKLNWKHKEIMKKKMLLPSRVTARLQGVVTSKSNLCHETLCPFLTHRLSSFNQLPVSFLVIVTLPSRHTLSGHRLLLARYDCSTASSSPPVSSLPPSHPPRAMSTWHAAAPSPLCSHAAAGSVVRVHSDCP